MTDRCAVPNCGGEADVVYLDHGVCEHHWNQLTAEDQPADALARALGFSVAMATMTEADMSESKETKTPKATKKAKAAKAAKPVKVAKVPKPKKERAPKEDLVVFACRVAQAEREKFHTASGPARASGFARKLMVVFSNEDESGFRTLLKEAKEARS